jgi:hypothetical protein
VRKVFLQSFSSHLHTLQEHVHEGFIDLLVVDGTISEDDSVAARKATFQIQLPSSVR